jgi:lipoprotein-releasing system permease protein
MYLRFAWRYFIGKKSANAINIIAWVTTGVIAFATCCQILVLSVFNGFEDIVKSLYSSFYTDIKITPQKGKTFQLDASTINRLKKMPFTNQMACGLEEKALIKNESFQAVVQLKGVDTSYAKLSGVPGGIVNGTFETGDSINPLLILGSGVQNALGVTFNEALPPAQLTVMLPKAKILSNDPLESISEANAYASGVFAIQQDFDNSCAITNLSFVQQQMGLDANAFSCVEIKLTAGYSAEKAKKEIATILGPGFDIKDKYEQNSSLYATMRTEKWAIYALLCLILIIAAFNMVSSLTMLVLEKKQDVSVLLSLGGSPRLIQSIFWSEGLLLGGLGTIIGTIMALIICVAQLNFKFIKLTGGSFVIDYFPVKLITTDILLVVSTSMLISFAASVLPSYKASKQKLMLR